MKTPIEQIHEALDELIELRSFLPERYSMIAVHVRMDKAIAALAALKSMEGQDVVAWTTKLALDVMKANEGTPFGIIEAASKNIWGTDAVPLYTTPRPTEQPLTPRLTVDEAMEVVRKWYNELGIIDLNGVSIPDDLRTRLTQAIKP